jgi:hypothetical protein
VIQFVFIGDFIFNRAAHSDSAIPGSRWYHDRLTADLIYRSCPTNDSAKLDLNKLDLNKQDLTPILPAELRNPRIHTGVSEKWTE